MIGVDRADSIEQIRSDLAAVDGGYIKLEMYGKLWDAFASVDNFPWRRFHYTKRQALDNLLGGIWDRVDFDQAGVNEKAGQQTEHLQTLRAETQAEIERLEMQMVASRPAIVGVIGASSPYDCSPPYGPPVRPWPWRPYS